MSSGIESDGKFNTSEKTELTSIEKTIQKIEEHIKDAKLDSPIFQAFADYADFVNAESLLRQNRHSSMFQMEHSLIKETIRQRQNGIIGYKKEYKDAEKLAIELGKAISIDREKGKEELDFHIYLGNIKNRAVDKKSQQT
jgi:hypothetical protein